MKLRLMLRYLLSKLQAMSSEVKSPRLLDMEAPVSTELLAAVGGTEGLLAVEVVEDDCFSPSM